MFSIPPDIPFLPTLIDALMAGELVEGFVPEAAPLIMADATIYVPNRRTARALITSFADRAAGTALILPRVRTLGDVEEEEFGIDAGIQDQQDLLPAAGKLERQLELAELVQRWVDALSEETRKLYGDEDIFIPSSQADAVWLAGELCGLLDQITREEINWRAIDSVVPDEHAQWWSLTAEFLKIIVQYWPDLLKEKGKLDPSVRSSILLERRLEHYRTSGVSGPVIVAGSTGSVPSTRNFLKLVASMEMGAVVLPGVDFGMDDHDWVELSDGKASDPVESHPQFGLASLLGSMGVSRDRVKELVAERSRHSSRMRLVNLSLALPALTSRWHEKLSAIDQSDRSLAFSGVSLIEADNERQEALAIAASLREVLEEPEKTAALVTPDRNLARRVSVDLQQFGIDVDDSSGKPLSNTRVGSYLRLLVRICFGNGTKSDLLSLLKSPFTLVGSTRSAAAGAANLFELGFLRGSVSAPVAGEVWRWISGLIETRGSSSVLPEGFEQHITNFDSVISRLLERADRFESVGLVEWLGMLLETLNLLAVDNSGEVILLEEEGWPEIQALVDDALINVPSSFEVSPEDLSSVLDAILAPVTARTAKTTHPRLHIFGPLEVRLQDYDRIIMAGLNEGTWPRATRNDAFLNRLMRLEIGMASPERPIGLSAHDFQQIMGKKEVILSRSTRVDRTPAIASRWVQRLVALVGSKVADEMRLRGSRYLEYASAVDRSSGHSTRVRRPAPTPAVETRPTSLPVTDIETWIRDPYALYAKRILDLRPLEPVEREADARLRGTLYHGILESYVSLDRMSLSEEERKATVLEIAENRLQQEGLPPETELLWMMRFEELAEHLIAWEAGYLDQHNPQQVSKEVSGGMNLAGKDFYLYARADRIDTLTDGSMHVIDYKTGANPTRKQARTLSPQLALEGAIAQAGGFGKIDEGARLRLMFLRLRNGRNFGEEWLDDEKNSVDDIIAKAVENLERLIAAYNTPSTGYVSHRAPFKESELTGEYDHLARVREWSFGEGADDGE